MHLYAFMWCIYLLCICLQNKRNPAIFVLVFNTPTHSATCISLLLICLNISPAKIPTVQHKFHSCWSHSSTLCARTFVARYSLWKNVWKKERIMCLKKTLILVIRILDVEQCERVSIRWKKSLQVQVLPNFEINNILLDWSVYDKFAEIWKDS